MPDYQSKGPPKGRLSDPFLFRYSTVLHNQISPPIKTRDKTNKKSIFMYNLTINISPDTQHEQELGLPKNLSLVLFKQTVTVRQIATKQKKMDRGSVLQHSNKNWFLSCFLEVKSLS